MKSFLLAAVAVLLSLATKAVTVPTPVSVDNFCIGESFVDPADNFDTPSYSAAVSKSDLANGGGWKRDADVVSPDAGVPFDPRIYCQNTLQGHCPAGTSGLWDQHTGHCYCGSAQAETDLVSRDGADDSRTPISHKAFCAITLKGRCSDGNCGLWNKVEAHCYCGPVPVNSSMSATTASTTSDMLIKRLLPQPLKFPTGISNNDWTAIEVALVLIGDSIKSQSDLHQVCTGAKDPQAFGFGLNIFRKLCTPEINMPVSQAEIDKAEQKVYSAGWIDTILQKYNSDVYGACDEAQRNGVISSTLDKQWIISQMCH